MFQASNCMQGPDFFSLLGLEPSFMLDVSKVSKAARLLQNECHPDKLAGQPPAVVDAARDRSALVNKATETLKSPHAQSALEN